MNIKKDDVPYHLHTMVDIVGNEKFLEICKMYGGSAVYIPVYKKVIMGERNRQLIKDFNGKNLDVLRFKYNMSKEHLKRIVDKEGM
ncbi:MAG: Mor transcription activator family protein [Clostridia bacterium]